MKIMYIVLLLAGFITASSAITCTPEYCKLICEDHPTPQVCQQQGKEYRPFASICQCCAICIDYLAPGQARLHRHADCRLPLKEVSYAYKQFFLATHACYRYAAAKVDALERKNVRLLVRIGERADDIFEKCDAYGVAHLEYEERVPPPRVIHSWIRKLRRLYNMDPSAAVAVQSANGYSQGAVLIGVALLEMGLSFFEAIQLIRKSVEGALGHGEYLFLSQYAPEGKLYFPRPLLPRGKYSKKIETTSL